MQLVLALMVKNEARSIRSIIGSCEGIVEGVYVMDTGSSDGTQALAVEEAARCRLPCVLEQEPFVDFGTSLNRCLEGAERYGDWVLRLAGDETLHGGDDLRSMLSALDKNVATVTVPLRIANMAFRTARITRSTWRPRYVGRIHEYLQTPAGSVSVDYDGASIYHDLTTRDHGVASQRFQRDLAWLLEDVQREPQEPRWVYFLAQTYETLGDTASALGWYRARGQMDGWHEEKYEAIYRVGLLTDDDGEREQAWRRCMELAPHRAEPLYQWALLCERQGRLEEARAAASMAASKSHPEKDRGIWLREVYDRLAPELNRRLAGR